MMARIYGLAIATGSVTWRYVPLVGADVGHLGYVEWILRCPWSGSPRRVFFDPLYTGNQDPMESVAGAHVTRKGYVDK